MIEEWQEVKVSSGAGVPVRVGARWRGGGAKFIGAGPSREGGGARWRGSLARLGRDYKWDKVTGKLPTEPGAPGEVLGPSRAPDFVPGAVGTQLTSSLQHTCEVDLGIFSKEQ